MKNAIVVVLALLLAASGVAVWTVNAGQQGTVADPRPPNGVGQSPAFAGQTDAPEQKTNVAYDVVPVLEGLQNPWGLAFLPDGRMLITEKVGTIRVIGKDGRLSEPLAGTPPVATSARSQGGMLDVALDPDFASNQLVYWSYSEPRDGGANNTAVARARLVGDATSPRLENVQVIFHQTPSLASTFHFGSRLIFGRDGTLFVTMGDRSIPEGRMQAQNLDSLIGKIARINTDGTVPKDNPFVGKNGVRPEIWSYGHRNIQAATLHPITGELWEVEHGTRGGDELNIARKAKDYGWPTIAYGIEYQGGPITGGITAKDGMEQPRYFWDPVIAPSGMIFYTADLFPAWKSSLFIGGLATRNLVRLALDGEKVIGEISAASQEQASGLDQVNHAMMQMEESTQRNAEMAQQTSSVAGSMTSQAKALTDLIALFKIQDATPVKAERRAPAAAKPAATPVTHPKPAKDARVAKVAGSDVEWQEF